MNIIDILLHLVDYIGIFIINYGILTYIIVFLAVFGETGFVVMPFLPGETLLFASGAFAAIGKLNYSTLYILFVIATILGNITNYFIGRIIGQKIIDSGKIKYLNKTNMNKAHKYINKYDAEAIVIARFIPIVRTIIPFLMGATKMNYKKFMIYSIIVGILWVSIFFNIGYFFGNIPLIQNNFSLVILLFVVLSLLFLIIEIIIKISKKKIKR